jgi:pseudaminic acid biosynthesis-associated methylase
MNPQSDAQDTPVPEFQTEQEQFWAGEFGTDYIQRNQGAASIATNLAFFSRALKQASGINSCMEFGTNIGLNLRALRQLLPNAALSGIEINADAARALGEWLNSTGGGEITHASILDWQPTGTVDLALIKGVLIHIAPDHLPVVYEKLYQSSRRYILIAEYYNPTPVSVPYRGHADRLFKRDFAGEMLDRYADLALVDYGFVYHRDAMFPQDDMTWFLLQKTWQ